MAHGKGRNRQRPIVRHPPAPSSGRQLVSHHATITAMSMTSTSSPIPPPEDMAKYEVICPGYADRLLKIVETQSAHRQDLERRRLIAGIAWQTRGQWLGGILGLAGLITYKLAIADRMVPAAGVFLGSVGALVAIAVWDRRRSKKELDSKLTEQSPIPAPHS